MTQTEALKQLREVHAIQGRDGCWDIDDYMLGLYNGLELALSIVENRACKYKQRPKSQPEQETVGKLQEPTAERSWFTIAELNAWADKNLAENPNWVMPTEEPERDEAPPQRTWVGLTDEEIGQGCKESWVTEQAWQSAVWWAEARLKEKNNG